MLERAAQVICAAVSCDCAAGTGDIVVAMRGFDYVASVIAADDVADDFHNGKHLGFEFEQMRGALFRQSGQLVYADEQKHKHDHYKIPDERKPEAGSIAKQLRRQHQRRDGASRKQTGMRSDVEFLHIIQSEAGKAAECRAECAAAVDVDDAVSVPDC